MNKTPQKLQSQQKQSVKQILSQGVYIQEMALGKVILIIGSKQNNILFGSHKRLLVYSQKDRTLSYSNQFPQSLPLKSINDIKFIKSSVSIHEVDIIKSKSKLNSIQIKSKKKDDKTKGSFSGWIFTFKTSKICNDIFQALNQVSSIQQTPPRLTVTPPSSPSLFDKKKGSMNFSKEVERMNDEQTRINYNNEQKGQFFRQQSFNNIGIKDSISEVKVGEAGIIKISFPLTGSDDSIKNSGASFSYVRMNSQSRSQKEIDDQKIRQSPSPFNLAKIHQKFQSYSKEYSQHSENQYQEYQYQLRQFPRITSKKQFEQKEDLKNTKLLLRSKNPSSQSLFDQQYYARQLNRTNSNAFSSSSQTHNLSSMSKAAFHKSIRTKIMTSQSQLDKIINQNSPSSSKHKKTTAFTRKKKNSMPPSEDWNERLFYQQNPYKVIYQFKQQSLNYFKDLVDSYILGKSTTIVQISKNKYSPKYQKNNIVLNVVCKNQQSYQYFTEKQRLLDEFQDYKYTSMLMLEDHIIRVPLVCLMNYKGFIGMSKALIVGSQPVNPQLLNSDFVVLSRNLNLSRQHLKKCCKFELVQFSQGDDIIFLNDFDDLLPKINGHKIKANLANIFSNQNRQSFITSHNLNEFRNQKIQMIIDQLNNLDTQIINSKQISQILQNYGINHSFIGMIYEGSEIDQVKEILLTQMIASTGAQFLQIQLQNILFHRLPDEQIKNFIFMFFVRFTTVLSITDPENADLYEVFRQDITLKYKISQTDCQIISGYLLSALIQKTGLIINYRELDGSVIAENNIELLDVEHLQGFQAQSYLPLFQTFKLIKQIIAITWKQKSDYGYQQLRNCLQTQHVLDCLNFTYFSQVALYGASIVQPDLVENIDFYMMIPTLPPTMYSLGIEHRRIKWCLQHQNEDFAEQILSSACLTVFLWMNEFHPLLSEFYDVFSTYYLLVGQQKQALTLAKSSVVNLIKIADSDSLKTTEKYYLLANIQNVCQKYQEALSNYQKVQQILSEDKQSSFPQNIIDIKIKKAGIYLCLNDYNQSRKLANQVLKATKDERTMIECYRIFGYIYKSLNEYESMKKNGTICYNQFEYCDDSTLYSKVLKIAIQPYVLQLETNQLKALLYFIQNKKQNQSSSEMKNEYYSYILNLRKKRNNILNIFLEHLDEIETIASEAKIIVVKKSLKSQQIQNNSKITFLQAVLGIIDIEDTIE